MLTTCMLGRAMRVAMQAAEEDGSTAEPPRRVLLVGEGNFSFALALARQCPKLEITATGFDSEEVLLRCRPRPSPAPPPPVAPFSRSQALVGRRYPEARGICARLRRLASVAAVLHDVDATQLHRLETVAPQRFDDVVFTHPHLGTEDARAHACLLGHFFHSARQLLRPGYRARVHVTLAADQADLWRLQAQAQRNKLRPVGAQDFDDALFQGYERKRTLSGKSFVSRAAVSRTFSFARQSVEDKEPATGPAVPWHGMAAPPPPDRNEARKVPLRRAG